MDEENNSAETQASAEEEANAGPPLSRGALISIAATAMAGISGIALLSTPDSDGSPEATPALLPASEQQMQRPPVPRNEAGEVDFIVRFDDVPEIEECLATFRQDPEHARSVFREWADEHPALSSFRLKKTNYSGELVLTWSGDGPPPPRAILMELRDRLQSMPFVKYADPDFSTQIEGGFQ
ncbi:MAG: hypothetical protein AAGF33_16670 [Pseudomonadota bacterium]